MSILQEIHGHEDLTALNEEQLKHLCAEIRQYLVSSVSKTGGHLASNLGAVELSVAVETVFNTMRDRLVFDVGHQSYVHKLLTGRQADFAHLRQYGGISGFPKPNESAADSFVAGHASSSVSIALGMARARTLLGEDYHVIALLGDGAATGGMVFEGLNDAAESDEPLVIILNDNEMSIDKNVGGVARHLYRLRTKEGYMGMKSRYRRLLSRIPGGRVVYRVTKRFKDRVKRFLLPTTIFENMGLSYLGPVDGHNLSDLISVLKIARDMHSPVVVHVYTKKGMGYEPAEKEPSKFHGIGKFDPESGQTIGKKVKSYSDAFGEVMLELAEENNRLCAITAAMPGGTGLLDFKKRFPDRLFDVGIAEEHAVSMAGGLAKQGMTPVVAIYSTFLQRAYDQIIQDVALMGLHVVFAIDRAGLVGEDGPTHHGVFDVGFLRQIPGMLVLCPASFDEMKAMLRWAVNDCNGPVAVRYPRGHQQFEGFFAGDPGAVRQCIDGDEATVISYGPILEQAAAACHVLKGSGHSDDVDIALLQLMSPTHFSREALASKVRGKHIFVVEEVCHGSGISGDIALCLQKAGLDCIVHSIDLGSEFVPHGDMHSLYTRTGLDNGCITHYIREVLRNEN